MTQDSLHSSPEFPPRAVTCKTLVIGRTCVVAALLGAVLETLVAPVTLPDLGVISLSLAVAVGAWLGICTLVVLTVLGIQSTERRLPLPLQWLLVGAMLIWIVAQDGGVLVSLVALLSALLTSLIALRSATPKPIAVVLVLGALAFMQPLLVGRAMQLVFSELQSIFVVFLGSLSLYGALRLILGVNFGTLATSPHRLVPALGTFLLALLLARANGLFLIRLWGFSTTEYLQVTLLLLEAGFLLPLSMLIARRLPSSAGVLMSLVLLAGNAVALSSALRDERVVFNLYRGMPHTHLVLSVVRTLWDADDDRFYVLGGTSECDDRDPKRNPLAPDVPGDGIDQNCVGGDIQTLVHSVLNPAIPRTLEGTTPNRDKVAILVVIDTLRADYVDYKLNNSRTPALASIAARSRVFQRAYAQSNNTLESFPHMLHMGFRTMPRYHEPWTLRHGLRLLGVTSGGFLQANLEHWWDPDFHRALLGFDHVMRAPRNQRRISVEENVSRAVDFLKSTSETGQFAFIHFEELHDSFTAVMEGHRLINSGLNVSELALLMRPDRTAEIMKKSYIKALETVDSALLRLWDAIQDLEKTKDVLLIVTSDHGEEFFEHGGFFHMGTLYEELVRVPLIIYQTSRVPSHVEPPVGLNRITPTLLNYFGMAGEYFDQMDLLSTPLLHTEIFSVFQTKNLPERRRIMVLHYPLKLIYDSEHGYRELYNLAADPQEKNNLAYDPAQERVLGRMEGLLDTTMFYLNYGDQLD